MSYSHQSDRVSSSNVVPSLHFPDTGAQRDYSSDFEIISLLAKLPRKRARRVCKEAKKMRRRQLAASHNSTDAPVITLSDSEEDDIEQMDTLPPKQPTSGMTTSAEIIQGEESPSQSSYCSFDSSNTSINVDDEALPRRPHKGLTSRQPRQSKIEKLVDQLMHDILWPKNG